uniref:Haemagluttinin repeat-containing protein n=1 Tax=Candidatus Kentrum sp. LPFa TaxID=2126335 RepID=A0A450X5S6_9GAMM|nr:MAG: Haemagluttinin repeat-containing protein [Candidatus Kentron sp. LPFa]VFK24571.1 MAG: Haemagluttinin repeat-containing protein [Candidatus Kentron sp. LPFa]
MVSRPHHAFLNGEFGSFAEQITRLYDAALAEAERFEQEGMPLTLGIALSPEQVKSLRHDMIWLEEREVAGARVLAPQLYLSQATLAKIETGTGPVISGGDVLLASEEDFGNQGTITARRDVGISSEGSFTNTGSVDAGESLVVDVKEDIVNRGPGSLYGGDLVALYAEGDIRNESSAEEIHLGEDIVSRMKDIASIGSGGNLILDAGGDIVQKAAKLGATGSAVLEAGGDISFETIALRNKSVISGSSRSSGLFGSSSSSYSATYDRTEHMGNEAVFGGDLVMKSGGDTTLTASRLEAGGGAGITTGGSFNLLSAQNTYHSESHYEYGGGWFGSSGSEDSVSDETRQVSSVLKVGKNLSLGSGRDINISASRVEVEGDARVTAAGNFNLLSKADTLSEASSKTHDGAFSESEEKHTKDTVDHVSAEFNAGEKLDIKAQQVNLVASTIKAREAEITADLIQLVSEKNLDSETHFSDGSGVLLRKIKNKGHVKEEVVEAGIQVAEKLVVNGRTLVEEGLGKDNLLKNLSSQSDLDIAGVKLIKRVANNKEWDDEITSLSATGQLLVQAVVAYFTAGVGAGAVNAGNAAVQAGIDAAINSLIQQATTQMVEAALTGNPPKFDTKAMLMGAITSAASGVASHGMDSALGEGLVADVQKTALKSTGRAVVETAVYGGDFRDRLGDNLKTGMVDLAGEKLAGKIGDNKESLGAVGHKTAHAALGCAMGAASGGQCAGGAGGAVGAVAAETVAELYGDSRLATGDVDQDNLDDFKAKTKLVGELAAIGGAVLTDTDAESAVLAGTNAVENNYLLHPQKKNMFAEMAKACGGSKECEAGIQKLQQSTAQDGEKARGLLIGLYDKEDFDALCSGECSVKMAGIYDAYSALDSAQNKEYLGDKYFSENPFDKNNKESEYAKFGGYDDSAFRLYIQGKSEEETKEYFSKSASQITDPDEFVKDFLGNEFVKPVVFKATHTSEAKPEDRFKLSYAEGQSGVSFGRVQVDLGQHKNIAKALGGKAGLTKDEEIPFLQQKGHDKKSWAKNSAVVKVNEFFKTDAGKEFVVQQESTAEKTAIKNVGMLFDENRGYEQKFAEFVTQNLVVPSALLSNVNRHYLKYYFT